MPIDTSDVGLRGVESMLQRLMVDEKWCNRTPRGFSWIGLSLEQFVEASPLVNDNGIVLSCLTARTPVVEGVLADEDEVVALINRLNRHALGHAYSYDPMRRIVEATASVLVHEQTLDFRVRHLSLFAAQQLTLAESEAGFLAECLGGSPSAREHHLSGPRQERDDLLNFLDTTTAQMGREGSRFLVPEEFHELEAFARGTTVMATLGASESGLTFDVSYGDSTCLLELLPLCPHRRAGEGLTVRLRHPMDVTPAEADAMANTLNLAEGRGALKSQHLGAWCWDHWNPEREASSVTLAYQLFLPNAVYQKGLMRDVVMSMLARARAVGNQMYLQPAQGNAWGRMLGNLRHFMGGTNREGKS